MGLIHKSHFKNPVVIVLLIILLVIGGYFLFIKNQNSKEIVYKGNNIYYLADASLSVYFPGLPKFSTTTQDFGNGNTVLDYAYDYFNPKSSELEVTYAPSAFANLTSFSPKENLKKEMLYTTGQMGGQIISSTSTEYDGLPAIDYLFYDKPHDAFVLEKDVEKGNDLYMFEYPYTTDTNVGNEDKQLEETFFNSITFSGNEKSVTENTTSTANATSTSNTFYTQSDGVNVRSCPSISCASVGTYPANTSFVEPYTSVDDLPDWVAFSYQDSSGNTQNGYISKTTLGKNPVVVQTATQNITNDVVPASPAENSTTPNSSYSQQDNTSNSSVSLSPSLINQIEPAIVEVNCWSAPDYTSGTSGSGISVLVNGTVEILSNYHVFGEAYVGTQQPVCYATYPEPPNFSFNVNYGDYNLTLLSYRYDPNTYEDLATFALGAPFSSSSALNNIPTLNNLPLLGLYSGCTNVNVGDELTIFGYPSSGNLLGVSETVTQGIVSGIDTGPIYKTDAPIDHGNSGGLAIRNMDSCILGIPTLGESGLTAGIGYIQSTNLLAQ